MSMGGVGGLGFVGKVALRTASSTLSHIAKTATTSYLSGEISQKTVGDSLGEIALSVAVSTLVGTTFDKSDTLSNAGNTISKTLNSNNILGKIVDAGWFNVPGNSMTSVAAEIGLTAPQKLVSSLTIAFASKTVDRLYENDKSYDLSLGLSGYEDACMRRR